MPTETLPCHAIWPFVSNGYAISRAHNTKRRTDNGIGLCSACGVSECGGRQWAWLARGGRDQYFDIDIGEESNRDELS